MDINDRFHEEEQRVPLFKREDKETLGTASAVFAFLAAVLAFAALIVAATNEKTSAASSANAVQVSLSEFAVTPAMITAPVDGKIVVTNNGTVEHNLSIEGTPLATKALQPGQSDTIDLKSVKAGTYTVSCQVPGHKSSGMVAMLHLGSGGAGGSTSSAADMRAGSDKADVMMKEPVTAYVAQLTKGANTTGVGNQKLAPKVRADGTKEFDLTSSIIDWQVSPGKTVKAWAYNGQVPGPWIKVN